MIKLSYGDSQFSSNFLKCVYLMFIFFNLMFYPIGEKFSFEFSFKIGLMPLLIFYATHIIQLLCWTPVGKLSYILGVQTRYFIPFALLPLIFSFNKDVRNKDKLMD